MTLTDDQAERVKIYLTDIRDALDATGKDFLEAGDLDEVGKVISDLEELDVLRQELFPCSCGNHGPEFFDKVREQAGVPARVLN